MVWWCRFITAHTNPHHSFLNPHAFVQHPGRISCITLRPFRRFDFRTIMTPFDVEKSAFSITNLNKISSRSVVPQYPSIAIVDEKGRVN